ncbi:MAG: hypothetical protein EON59_17815 [Alphaproteobacteria bacterium]|nr:MAG: hypothetical protein EON59_17815 [Alphaproteobacteria bacterium]
MGTSMIVAQRHLAGVTGRGVDQGEVLITRRVVSASSRLRSMKSASERSLMRSERETLESDVACQTKVPDPGG